MISDLLIPLVGVEWASTLALIIWLLIAILVIWIAWRIYLGLAGGIFLLGGKGRAVRLAVIDAAPIDQKRRIVLIRRDGVEHLVMIGGPNDFVIEQGINAASQQGINAAPQTVNQSQITPTTIQPKEPAKATAPILAATPVAAATQKDEPALDDVLGEIDDDIFDSLVSDRDEAIRVQMASTKRATNAPSPAAPPPQRPQAVAQRPVQEPVKQPAQELARGPMNTEPQIAVQPIRPTQSPHTARPPITNTTAAPKAPAPQQTPQASNTASKAQPSLGDEMEALIRDLKS